ncbi:MAG: hypothetical protein C0467_18620 [Planctomycetaceae bacterium]|nr:hypothetical protein [Planctomycetaceae bacterium]
MKALKRPTPTTTTLTHASDGTIVATDVYCGAALAKRAKAYADPVDVGPSVEDISELSPERIWRVYTSPEIGGIRRSARQPLVDKRALSEVAP